MVLSNTAKVVLAFVVGLLTLAAKQFFGVADLQPDLLAVGSIVPIVSLLSFIGPLRSSTWGKAAIAVAIGVVWGVISCATGTSKILCGLNGVANGLMACGLWSVAKAGAESAKAAATSSNK